MKPPLTAAADRPYGVRLNGIGSVNSFQNRYEMQGHEKESTFGLNRINFGARTLNPTTGVWDRIDPMSEKYFGFSPYNYTLNNPINAIDPDGKEAFDWIKFKNGGIAFDPNIKNQAQTTATYGAGATDLGKSGVFMNTQGQ